MLLLRGRMVLPQDGDVSLESWYGRRDMILVGKELIVVAVGSECVWRDAMVEGIQA